MRGGSHLAVGRSKETLATVKSEHHSVYSVVRSRTLSVSDDIVRMGSASAIMASSEHFLMESGEWV